MVLKQNGVTVYTSTTTPMTVALCSAVAVLQKGFADSGFQAGKEACPFLSWKALRRGWGCFGPERLGGDDAPIHGVLAHEWDTRLATVALIRLWTRNSRKADN